MFLNTNRLITPCYNCRMREIGCHSVCLLYEDYRIDLRDIKQNIKSKYMNVRSDAYIKWANSYCDGREIKKYYNR